MRCHMDVDDAAEKTEEFMAFTEWLVLQGP